MSNKPIDAARVAVLAAAVKAITDEVVAENIGRESVVKATWLSLVSGKPAFFLGAPGVNKTGTVEAMAKRIDGAVFYDALMPTVVSPEQLLVENTSIEEMPTAGGGKSIRMRDTLGRAAGAHLLFADEIWKGDSRVLQTVLDLANGDGVRSEGKMVKTPLRAFLSASNELAEEGSSLAAMWSRMTIRVNVVPLDKAGKQRMLAARLNRGQSMASAKLALAEVDELRAARKSVTVDQSIIDTVLEIYEKLIQGASDGSFAWLWADDRRFGRVFDVLQANALLDGRIQVTKQDLRVLNWLLWDTPEQIAKVEAIVAPYVREPIDECRQTIDELLAAGGTVVEVCEGRSNQATKALQQINAAKSELISKSAALGAVDKQKVATWTNALSSLVSIVAQGVGGAINREEAMAAYEAVKILLA